MNKIIGNMIPQKEVYHIRITKMVDRLLQESEVFQEELNREETIESLTDKMQRFSIEEFLMIDDDDLSKRIGRLMALDMLSMPSDDFTPEQKKIFNEAVHGR